MTKETKVLDSTVFMSLSNADDEWATSILDNYINFRRKDTTSGITKSNFNIKYETNKLNNKYSELLTKTGVEVYDK